MKKSLLFIMSLILALPLFAQNPSNISVKDPAFKYKYRVMPKSPQDPLFFNYGIMVELTPAVKTLYDESSIKKMFNIEGQNKIDDFADDDYIISLTLDNLIIKSSDVKKSSSSTDYYVQVVYTFGSKVKFSKDGTVLDDITLCSAQTERSYVTSLFETAVAARDYWSNNKDVLKDQLLKGVVNESISSANKALTLKYGFLIDEASGRIQTMNEKKHSENIVMNEKSSELMAMLKTLDGTMPLTQDDLLDYITYFQELPEKYTTTSKADAKIRYIAYYNLAMIYLLLDQPLQTITYADKLIANAVDPKDGERLKKQANQLIDIFLDSYFKTRQFDTAYF